jgi:site-specific DNA recombinase
LLFGPTGVAMTPVHTRRSGRLYRDYASSKPIASCNSDCALRRIPAAQIEAVVLSQVKAMVQTPEIIVATWRAAKASITGLTERQVRDELGRFDEIWWELFPAEQARIVQLLVERVDVSETGADITLRVDGLASLMQDLRAAESKKDAA